MARISLVLLLFAGVLLLSDAVLPAQTTNAKAAPASRDFPIDSITIEGNRIPAAAIVEASGLKKRRNGQCAIFDAARDRLIASGYFDSVGYRYKAVRNRRL